MSLPLDILLSIGTSSVISWHSMLSIPSFARWTLSPKGKKHKEIFIVTKKQNRIVKYNLAARRHNFNELPAVTQDNDLQLWYQKGQVHRDNGPAIICKDGTRAWYQNGLLHRDNDLPALIDASGTREWYQRGLLHRNNDLPAIVYAKGTRAWYQNGLLYRDNGQPVIIWA